MTALDASYLEASNEAGYFLQDQAKYYNNVVLELGGQLLKNRSATHYVSGSLMKSEMMLAFIASGKWVLHTSYLDDSSEAEYFLQASKLTSHYVARKRGIHFYIFSGERIYS